MKLFELFATLGLQTDSFDRGIRGAVKQGNSFASSLSGNFTAITAKAVALGNAMYDVGKAAAKASVDAVKSIITEFADTEQLLGGVETIFKGSAQKVIDNAGEAFRTAGMSANEYMETVTSFSSSLLQGLGGDTEAAAAVADMAIRDMSDNANKFGTNIGMIQNAYQGFARDNFTMLDNLKLGYGGTQEEMARLINDSGVLGDTIVTASTVAQVPLDKMFEAIHIIQTEMDITGTTAKEASSTIAGSFNAFTAAWKNAISGMADNKDMDKLIDDLFETGENLVANVVNLLPRIWRNVTSGVDSLLDRWDFTRTLKNAYSVGGWAAVWDAATAILKRTLGEWGTLALDAGSNLLSQVLTGLTGDTVTAEEIKTTISGLWTAGTASLSELVTSAGSVLSSIYTAITGDPATMQNISNTLGGIFSAGVSARKSTVDTFVTFFADVADVLDDPTSEKSIKEKLVDVFTSGTTAMSDILVAAGTLVADVYGAITGDTESATKLTKFFEDIFGTANGFLTGMIAAAGEIGSAFSTMFSGIKDSYDAFYEKNRDFMGAVFGIAGAAILTVNPLLGAAVLGKSAEAFGITDVSQYLEEAAEETGYATEELDSMGYTAPSITTGTPEFYDPTADPAWSAFVGKKGEEYSNLHGYTPEDIESALDAIKNGDPFEIPVVFTDSNGQDLQLQHLVPEYDDDGISGMLDRLLTAITGVETQLAGIPSALSGATVNMDGTVVGNLILPTVSSGIARMNRVLGKTVG